MLDGGGAASAGAGLLGKPDFGADRIAGRRSWVTVAGDLEMAGAGRGRGDPMGILLLPDWTVATMMLT